MKDYLLFIDTEASGLPKNWSLPYSAPDNWPFSVQISWLLYSQDGKILKQENHYIHEDDFKIAKPAIKVHGITHAFLTENGKSRKEVMKLLRDDVIRYEPLIIGHFMDFDLHMLGADFYRTGIENPVKKEMAFCTMLATTHSVKNPSRKYFKLGELYETLFGEVLNNQHNALADAKATADCFFELMKRGEIDDNKIESQQREITEIVSKSKPASGCIIPALIICITILIFLCV